MLYDLTYIKSKKPNSWEEIGGCQDWSGEEAGEWVNIVKGHKLLVTRMNNFGGLMYSLVTINNLWLKLTRGVDLKSSHHK